ncbi:MAG: (d)CMP kinase [Nitriliruptorales bacterium]|nr:(d)CMP kinase [Nitriliruptorales bacterium]
MTVVAIDGPAGSGKSTISAALAERLNLPHVDTGAYYRAATWIVVRAGVPVDDAAAMLDAIKAAEITRESGRTCVNGLDIEADIRGDVVTAAVSSVAGHDIIRGYLVQLQRRDIPAQGAVVEGRDAGTVVVPGADLKVWLIAAPGERARRRAAQLGTSDPAAITAHAADIARRDTSDAAQMRRAEDAVEVDTTGRSITDIVADLAARVPATAPPTA